MTTVELPAKLVHRGWARTSHRPYYDYDGAPCEARPSWLGEDKPSPLLCYDESSYEARP